jgi:hypothetical protein
MADKFQEDFSQLQNLRLSDPEKALREYIAKAEERERSKFLFFTPVCPLNSISPSFTGAKPNTYGTSPNIGKATSAASFWNHNTLDP